MNHENKDSFVLKFPREEISTTEHLPDHLANMCIGATQTPLNPHRQRMLAASARKPKVPSAGGPAEEGAKPKGRGKAKAKAKATPKVSAAPKEPSRQAEVQRAARESYQTAKKNFMDKLLSLHEFLGIVVLQEVC